MATISLLQMFCSIQEVEEDILHGEGLFGLLLDVYLLSGKNFYDYEPFSVVFFRAGARTPKL